MQGPCGRAWVAHTFVTDVSFRSPYGAFLVRSPVTICLLTAGHSFPAPKTLHEEFHERQHTALRDVKRPEETYHIF